MHYLFYNENKTTEMVITELHKLKKIISKYNYNVPIYDILSMEPLDNHDKVKKLVKEYF